MKTKFTKMEKAWILYDVGNSAFVLLIATIVPIYFNYLSESAGISLSPGHTGTRACAGKRR